jgi:DNA-binding CsgD family transcriptional regulator
MRFRDTIVAMSSLLSVQLDEQKLELGEISSMEVERVSHDVVSSFTCRCRKIHVSERTDEQITEDKVMARLLVGHLKLRREFDKALQHSITTINTHLTDALKSTDS